MPRKTYPNEKTFAQSVCISSESAFSADLEHPRGAADRCWWLDDDVDNAIGCGSAAWLTVLAASGGR